ncbi:MAG: methionyl-tRNA formyltransferase [Granulosicoccus sp.]|jgi:methionyl-tRNA formyltransferase
MERKEDLKARIVFMGTPDFAVATMDALNKAGNNIVGVVTAPDRPAGRGQKARASAVKEYAVEHGLKVLQPEKLRNEEFLDDLRSLNADLFIVVAFRMLPEAVWAMPSKGTINLHASLLPQYRGAAPINWAIINGEKQTGVTTFFIQKEIDTGDLIHQEKVKITEEMNAGELHDQLMNVGAGLIVKTVEDVMSGDHPSTPQSEIAEGALRSAPKIQKETCRINWKDSVENVVNLIRGMSPYPAAFTEFEKDGQNFRMKVFQAKKVEGSASNSEPGTLIQENDRLLATCSNGVISLEEVQLSGKKRMLSGELLRGFSLEHVVKIH